MNWRYGTVVGLLLLVFVGLTFVSTVVTQPPADDAETFTNRSVYNAKPSGYRAWHAVLQKAGVETTLWRNSFEYLDEFPKNGVMVLIEPHTAARTDVVFGEDQAATLLRWVARGHTAILIDDFHRTGSRAVLNKLDLYLENDKRPRATPGKPVFFPLVSTATLEAFVTRPVLTEVNIRFDKSRLPTDTIALVDSKQSGNPVFVWMTYGRGDILLGTVTDLADNSFLQNKEVDNYQLLSNVLRYVAQGRPLIINEFVHGYSRVGDLLSYYHQRTPLGKVLTQLLLVFMLMLWLSFVPWKPKSTHAVEEKDKRDVTLAGFIDSLAGIYYRSRAASLALSPALGNIELQLRRRYRMGLNEPERVAHLLEGLMAGYSGRAGLAGAKDLIGALEKARQTVARRRTLPHAELLKVSQQLSLIQDVLQYGNAERRSRAKN